MFQQILLIYTYTSNRKAANTVYFSEMRMFEGKHI